MNWKVLAAAALGIVVAVLGALYYIAGTPQYSLYLIRRAVQQGDRGTVIDHIDVSKVVSRAVDRAVGGIPAGPRIVSQKAQDTLIPAANKIIRERLDERLDDPGSAPVLSMSIQSVAYRNDGAVVTLKDPASGSTTVITMTQMPNRHWKIVDIDLGSLNVAFTLDEVRKRAEDETPNFPNVPPQMSIPQPGAPGAP